MPAPDKMLATLTKAVERVKATPGRAGHVVALQNCREVLVVGDLHGNVGNFQSVWKRADLANHPGRHLVLQELVHGKFQYPNGGDKSHQTVDLFAAVKCQFPDRVHYLPGNHEMGQWTGRPILKGADDLNASFFKGVQAGYGVAAAPAVYALYEELFRVCPLFLRTPNRVGLCHTLVPGKHLSAFDPAVLTRDVFGPADLEPWGTVYSILWGRDVSAGTAEAFGKVMDVDLFVTGHIPADEGFTVPNDRQVTLDCAQSPGGYVLFPAAQPITHQELVAGIGTV